MNVADAPDTRAESLIDRPCLAWAVLALVTLLGAALRFHEIDESLWLDELHTAWTISGSLTDITQRAAAGNYSPAYFFLCWAATRILGMSEVVLRLPSLVPGILLMPLAYAAVVNWTHSRVAGVLAAWLIALDAIFLTYAREARPYALIQCVGLVHVLVFWSILQTPTWRRRTVFVVLGILLFYLHYTAILLVIAEAVAYSILLVCCRDRPNYRPAQLALDIGLMALACLPAMGHLMAIAARRHNWRAFVRQRSFVDSLSNYPYPLMLYVYLPVGLAAGVAIGRKLARQNPFISRVDWRLVILVLCWCLVPIGLAWAATSTDVARLLFPRYVIVAALAPIVAAGLACATGAGRWIRVALAAAVAAAVVVVDLAGYHHGPLRPYLHVGRYATHGEDWRGAVCCMNRQGGGREQPIFVQPGLIEADGLSEINDAELTEYCLFPVTSAVYPLDTRRRGMWPLRNVRPLVTDPESVVAAVDQRGAWLVIRGSAKRANDTLRCFAQAFRGRGVTLKERQRQAFAGVHIIHLEIVP